METLSNVCVYRLHKSLRFNDRLIHTTSDADLSIGMGPCRLSSLKKMHTKSQLCSYVIYNVLTSWHSNALFPPGDDINFWRIHMKHLRIFFEVAKCLLMFYLLIFIIADYFAFSTEIHCKGNSIRCDKVTVYDVIELEMSLSASQAITWTSND